MKKLTLSLGLGLFFLLSCSHKLEQNRFPSEAPLNIEWSRFTPVEYMPEMGKYRGQTVETDRRRALQFLTLEEKVKLNIPTQQLAFANFRHSGVFYIATFKGIKVDSQNNIISTEPLVEKIILSEKHWAAKIRKETKSIEAHAEFSFFIKPGQEIQLIANQDLKTKLLNPRILKEPVVFSVEAVRSANDPNADFFPAALGPNFAIAMRIESNTERNQQHLDDPDRIIISNRLVFDQTKSQLPHIQRSEDSVLVRALGMSVENQRSHAYEVMTNNCTNNLFKILDQSVIYKNNINTETIRKAVIKFNKKDLPKIIDYLKAQRLKAAQDNIYVDKKLDDLIQELTQYNEGQIKTMKISETFMTSVPAFIEGHLKARGLIN